jgi:hypothetical protein
VSILHKRVISSSLFFTESVLSLAASRRLASGEASAHGAARDTTGAIGDGFTGIADGVDAVARVVASRGDESKQPRVGAFYVRD